MSADLIPLSPTAIEQAEPAMAAEMVTAALVESRGWLSKAMEGTDPTPLANFKAWAATVEEATKQKNLGREIELDAAEMVRRAERGIGVAIRRGQEAGEIRRQGQGRGHTQQLPRPTDFASHDELMANQAGIYNLTDAVTDEQFDEAITEAKAEGNLSRANVVRKVKKTEPPRGDRPDILRKTHRINPDRLISESIAGAGLPPESVFAEVDFNDLDAARLEEWVSSLTHHIAALRSLRNRLTKELTRRG